jgi:hypothetical protein
MELYKAHMKEVDQNVAAKLQYKSKYEMFDHQLWTN